MDIDRTLPRRSLRTRKAAPVKVSKPRKKKSAIKKVQEDINLLYCRWENGACAEKFDDRDDYHKHVEKHIQAFNPIKSNKFICPWKFCKNFVANSADDFARHCYYHVYQEILLRVGRQTKKKYNLLECTYGDSKKYLVPEIKRDFICNWIDCNYKFQSIVSYHNHVRGHCDFEFKFCERGPANREPVKCGWEFCSFDFKDLFRMKEHMMKHTGTKFLACPECGQQLRRRKILEDHCNRQLGNNSEEFQCEQCFKGFANERLLRIHFRQHINLFKCNLCDMTCSSRAGLVLHIRSRHINEKPFKCDQCDYKAVVKGDLRKHIERIHENILFECLKLGCNYSTKSKYKLQKHYSQIHEKIPMRYYGCHCCDKIYKSGTNLSKHLIKAHSFQLPSGHTRFRYTMDENGMYRLQLTRIETLEVQEMLSPAATTMKECLSFDELRLKSESGDVSYTDRAKSQTPQKSLFVEDENEEDSISKLFLSLSEL